MPGFSEIAAQLIRYRNHLLMIAVALAAVLAYPSTWPTLDRSIERMFAEDDPLLPPFHHLKRVFGGNEIILTVYHDAELLDENRSGLERLRKIREQLETVAGVKGILSLDLPIGERVVDRESTVPANIRKLFEGYTHGADGCTVCVACMLHPEAESPVSHAETIQSIREIMAHLPDGLAPGIVAGEPVLLNDAFAFIIADGNRLLWYTTILLALVIFVCFRSIRWMLIPIVVVQFALLLTNGLLGLARVELSMVSSTFTAVITVIGIATIVHVIVRFQEARAEEHSPLRAMTQTVTVLAAPVFWACVTDAVGFGSLLASSVNPVRDFGMMMALGSLMVLVSVVLIVPGLALLGRFGVDPKRPAGEAMMDRCLLSVSRFVQRHTVFVAVLTVVVTSVLVYGIRWTETESDFTKNFRKSSAIVQSYNIVESKLGGAGVCDIVIQAPDFLTWDFICRVLRLECRLQSEVVIEDASGESVPGLTKVFSLADAVLGASPINLSRKKSWLRDRLISAELKTMRRAIPEFYDALYAVDPEDSEKNWFRIMLRANEQQPAMQKMAIIQQVRDISAEEFPDSQISGYFVMLTRLIDSILRDQWTTFGVALAGMLVVMTIALRSVRLALMAVLPNAIPILMVNGAMGWLGLTINMGAVMIAAVSIGLSIDGSIHYLMSFQRARKTGMSITDSLGQVQQSVGRAMVLSTIALMIGFTAMAISQFVPTVYFGVLVSVAMFGGLIGNLVWLPMLLKWFAPREVRRAAMFVEPSFTTA